MLNKDIFSKILIIIFSFFVIAFIVKEPPEKIYKINVVEEVTLKTLIDDFNNGINYRYWNILDRGNNYNNELQYYRTENIKFTNNFLEIEALKENYKNHNYTSGLITTKDKFAFLYGKVIVKIKPAVGKGVLSAVWLLPADDSLFPEIDMIESLGSDKRHFWTGVHYLDSSLVLRQNFVDYIVTSDFVIYELYWSKEEIKCYVDNKLVYVTNVGIPHKKMFLNINLAIGGNWPRNPDDNMLPTKLLIDYVIIIPEKKD